MRVKATINKIGTIDKNNVVSGFDFTFPNSDGIGWKIDTSTGRSWVCGYTLDELREIIRESNLN